MDDKGELCKKMCIVVLDYCLKLKDYYFGVSCSGNSFICIVMLSNVVEVGLLLVKKMLKSDLFFLEVDGKIL